MDRRRFLGWFAAVVPGAALLLAAATANAGGETDYRYSGNTDSKIFHRQGCRYYGCGACTAKFKTRDDAIQAGYRPCKTCKP